MAEGGKRVSPVDARVRVVAIALEPALRLARVLALPLDDLQELVTYGYFREARARGLSLRAIAKRFDKSLRTIATMSKRFGAATRPLETSQTLTLRRQLVASIAAEPGPAEDLLERFKGTPAEEVEAQLENLVDEGILDDVDGELRVRAAYMGLTDDDLDHRLESLRHFLLAVTQVIYRRFYRIEAEREAFARVLTFNAAPEDLEELRGALYELLKERAIDADRRAEAADDARQASVTLSVVEVPTDRAFGR